MNVLYALVRMLGEKVLTSFQKGKGRRTYVGKLHGDSTSLVYFPSEHGLLGRLKRITAFKTHLKSIRRKLQQRVCLGVVKTDVPSNLLSSVMVATER